MDSTSTQPSISAAKANAREHGVADRVRFQALDAGAAELAGRYDLVIDLRGAARHVRPVDVLRTARSWPATAATVLVIDEKTDEEFSAPGSDLDRLFYGFSILICLPDGMSHEPSAATGTVMRPATLRRYAQEAGFKDVVTAADRARVLPRLSDAARPQAAAPARSQPSDGTPPRS